MEGTGNECLLGDSLKIVARGPRGRRRKDLDGVTACLWPKSRYGNTEPHNPNNGAYWWSRDHAEILAYIAENGPCSAFDVQLCCHQTERAARRHLAALKKEGKIVYRSYSMSDLDSKYFAEIKATGLDYIPKRCPGFCREIDTFENDIIVYGRRVFCRRRAAIVTHLPEKPPKMIPVKEAIDIDKEAIRLYDDQIKGLVNRKEQLEGEIKALEAFA
jgi:hypothetical protein